MMDLYKRKNQSSIGLFAHVGKCLSFWSLSLTLLESVELRHAPWLLWITDLAAMDKFFVLPLIMGATMYIQQLLNPQPTDPMQAKVLKIMPVMFTAFMLWFPSGLCCIGLSIIPCSSFNNGLLRAKIEGAKVK
ncbi:MAG: YidC/Oxa1 family membrane protein insertase [Moraxellaceae bacterium]|nr:YidC/Oxa1 family membrane protein insertase [Moraxellaceae bacterium]